LYLLQPLNIGYFSILKHFYGQTIQDLAYIGSTDIKKLDFLHLYPTTHTATYTTSTITSSFMASGIIPYTPKIVLSKLKVHPPSPTLPPSRSSTSSHKFIPHTPSKAINFRHQAASIKRLLEYRDISPNNDIYQQLEQTTKGTQLLTNQLIILTTTYKRIIAENR
jgi:hypothetical protein